MFFIYFGDNVVINNWQTIFLERILKMVTLGDVSVQLLKPAKDLADWKFPLSQTLEDYYALLEEPCDVNFGEAGLVVQNSTNAYVRRVEQLYKLLKQTTEEEEKNRAHKEKTKRSHVDFDNFVLIDLEKDVGKNIDRKGPSQGQKKIKLLSRRFTQLENHLTQMRLPIKVYDVTGEVIGKKYDFRCNRAVNINGMLVDELTSYDFTCIPDSPIREERHSISIYSEPKTPGTGTSGYHSFQTDDSIMLHDDIHDEFEDEHNYSPKENVAENQSDFIANNESTRNSYYDFSPVEDDRLNQTISGTDMLEERNELNTVETSCDSLIENTERVTDSKKETNKWDNDLEPSETKEQMKRNKRLTPKKKKKDKWKLRIPSARCISDLSKDLWKPTKGAKDDTCMLEIPENIPLLDSKLSRKRKRVPGDREPQYLTRYMLREKSLPRLNDVQSPRKTNFKCLREHELEDFMRDIDKCLKTFETEDVNGNRTSSRLEDASEPLDNVQRETVTNTDTELLDSRVSSNDQDESVENENEIGGMRSRCSSFADVSLPSSIYDNSACNAIERSPDSSDDWSGRKSTTANDSSYLLSNYETLIEEEMREIFKDEDATELDQTVAYWHAFLQPRLLESESQAEFRIHEYTSSIIGSLRESQHSTFDNIVQGKPPYDVARYFLATLQLANTCNVEIKKNCDNIELKLLTDKGNSKRTK